VLLAGINNGDKHRVIQPVWAFPGRVRVEVMGARDCTPRARPPWESAGKVLEVGTELTFIRARKLGPDPELDLRLKVAPEPVIGTRIGLKGWGKQAGVFVFTLLSRFSDQPASILEIGADLVETPEPARS
jgi:hypothetical protein